MVIPVNRVKNKTCGFSNLLQKYKLISSVHGVPETSRLLKYQNARTGLEDVHKNNLDGHKHKMHEPTNQIQILVPVFFLWRWEQFQIKHNNLLLLSSY